MKPLTYQRKKENIIFLLQLLQSFFKTGPKPKFLKSILKDQSFFSLIKNTYLLDFAYSELKNFSEFQNTWLKNEIENYLPLYKERECQNLKTISLLSEIRKETNIPLMILKEYNYKLHPEYSNNKRYSNDVDVVILKKDLFEIDKKLMEKGFMLKFVDFDLDFQPILYKDDHIIIYPFSACKSINIRKKEISHGIRNNEYKNFNYFLPGANNKGGLLEVHFFPNSYCYPKNHLPLTEAWKYSYNNKHNLKSIDPAIRILYDADHFFIHLLYHRISKNGLNTFLCNFERLCDLGLNLLYEKSIDWDKLIKTAAKYNISANAYGYLWFGKKWLNLEIPQNVIAALKKQSNKIQIKLIHSLNALNIFQDKRDFKTNLYVKLFLLPMSKK